MFALFYENGDPSHWVLCEACCKTDEARLAEMERAMQWQLSERQRIAEYERAGRRNYFRPEPLDISEWKALEREAWDFCCHCSWNPWADEEDEGFFVEDEDDLPFDEAPPVRDWLGGLQQFVVDNVANPGINQD
jgi:hypothetical protein